MNINIKEIKEQLDIKGYHIVENVLDYIEVEKLKKEFNNWKESVPDYKRLHPIIHPHGIHKFFEVGHTRFAWLMRINKKFKQYLKEYGIVKS